MQLLLSSGNDTIPDIDFSKYSLVIGYHMVGNNVGEKIPKEKKQQTLYDSEGSYVFELGYTYQKIEENHATVCSAYPIINWGLYPKLDSNRPIKTQMTFIK